MSFWLILVSIDMCSSDLGSIDLYLYPWVVISKRDVLIQVQASQKLENFYYGSYRLLATSDILTSLKNYLGSAFQL